MLPPNESTFHLKVVGERTKKVYEGDFTAKCVLTNGETIEVGLKLDRYNGGSTTLAPQFVLMNRVLAELEVRLKKSPEWWRESDYSRTLQDQNVMYEVFKKAMEAEKAWTDKLNKESEEVEKKTEKKKKKEVEEALRQ